MKKIIALVLSLCLVFALCSCGGSSKNTELIFATGGEAGTYYAYGSVIAQYVSNNTDLSVTAVVGNGSKANVEDLDSGDVQLGFCQSDVMSYAYKGTNLFENAIDSFSVVAALYMEQVQIVTTNPDIKTVADLAGKTVSIGAAGSGTYFNAIDILGVYGLTENDINPVYQSFGDSAESLKDGKIDAAIIVAGAPTNAITDLSTSKQAYIVSLDDAHIEQLVASSPYYSRNVIAASTYGTPEDAQTVAVAAMILARDDVSENTIYQFTKTIFENKDKLEHGKAADLDVAFASSIQDVPFHKGAVKYFKEKGITVPGK